MIFCKDLLFIHIPKTGGMSVSKFLLQVLPRPVYYTLPTRDENLSYDGIVQILGPRHESLEEARKGTTKYGFDVCEFPLVLAVLRNPYSLEVSRYEYLRLGRPIDRGPNQHLALTSDFETFASESSNHGGPSRPIESYFLLDGKMPKNLEIIRFESLADDVGKVLRKIGITCNISDFPWVNRSSHSDYKSYYSQAAEEAVYRRYKWVFDHGSYERMDPREFSSTVVSFPRGDRLPTVGPVRTVGPRIGYWRDSWVGPTLRFAIVASKPIEEITIEGAFPLQCDGTNEFVLTVNKQEFVASFDKHEGFVWTVPCRIMANAKTQIDLTSSSNWCPKQLGISEDGRQLSFKLVCVVFERLRA